jgi:2-keto-4-pentenoate hydratase/2-oxohepta-3-ene-1,7-dioic acid hydratase in catechol pathway
MQLAAYRPSDTTVYGLVEGSTIRRIPGATSLVDAWTSVLEGRVEPGLAEPLDPPSLANPVVPVRNLFCVGWNYTDHFAEGAAVRGPSGATELPAHPAFFTKATTTVIGPFEDIEAHGDVTDQLDWEVELAMVIGRGGRDIDEAAAMDHVLGFAVADDVSARDVQRAHGGQWFRGKSLDGTCPIGPWVVTPDELGPLATIPIVSRVNGETMQSATLGDLHFGVERIIAELSRGLTLLPGDVILTGTPSGVGFARTPPRFLSPGDVVEAEIGGIGTIRNVVRG